MTRQSGPALERSLRLAVGTIGGYAFAAGFVALIAAGLPAFGMARSESATLGGILGVLAFLGVLIWAVASARPVRATVLIFVAAASMIAAAPRLLPG